MSSVPFLWFHRSRFFSKASSEASKAEHKIDQLTAEILALEATLSATVEAGQKKRSSHKNLAQIEALEAELKQLEHRLGTTNLDQYQTQLETTRKRSAELDTSCIAVQRSLVALRESNDGASRDIDKHATVLNVASSALAPLQQELSSLDRQYNTSLTTIRTLKELWSSGKASRIRAAVHELSSKHIGVIGLLCTAPALLNLERLAVLNYSAHSLIVKVCGGDRRGTTIAYNPLSWNYWGYLSPGASL